MWKNNHKSSESSNYPTKCPKLLLSEFQSAKTLKKLKARRTNLAWSLLYKLQVSATTSLGGTQWEAQQPPLLLNPDRPQALLNTCTPSWPPQMGRETPQQVLSSHKVFAFNNYLPLITTALDLYIKKYLPLLYRQELTSVKKRITTNQAFPSKSLSATGFLHATACPSFGSLLDRVLKNTKCLSSPCLLWSWWSCSAAIPQTCPNQAVQEIQAAWTDKARFALYTFAANRAAESIAPVKNTAGASLD